MQRYRLLIAAALVAPLIAGCNRFENTTPQINPTSTPLSVVTSSPSPTSTMSPSATPSPTSVQNPTPVPSPTATTPTTANASGTVVDFTANTPLSGVQISIATSNGQVAGVYQQVATTDSSGNFQFSTTPGQYVLAVGTNSSADTTRATEHDVINLAYGTNKLVPQTPKSVPNVTIQPSQTSGHFRLALLSSNETNCLEAFDTGRTSDSLPLVIEDEYALEDSRAVLAEQEQQTTANPNPLSTDPDLFLGNYDQTGFYTAAIRSRSCSSFANTYTFQNGSPAQDSAENTMNWYGANYDGTYGNEYFLIDPSQVVSISDAKKRQR